ncbi:MAG TPA: nucleotide exchange factor GrpE [Capsulimonadaceae bacterium]|jgi:molecular chaperone GrpE
MTKKLNPNGSQEAEEITADASPAAEYTPSIIRDEDAEYESGGRQPIELDEALNADDLAALFTSPSPKPGAEGEAADDTAAAAVAAVAAEQLAALQAEVESNKNNYLRAVADLHNYRRRSEEEIKRIRATANERLIKEVLPIVDDFQLSLGAAQKAQSYEQLVGGVEAVLRKFLDTLAKQGVEPIPSVGEKFNPDVHEAVMVDEGTDMPEDTVTEELRSGYTLHGKVIRPSLVKVAGSQ